MTQSAFVCSKLTIETLERGVKNVNFEHISHFVLVFLLLSLSKQMPTGSHAKNNSNIKLFAIYFSLNLLNTTYHSTKTCRPTNCSQFLHNIIPSRKFYEKFVEWLNCWRLVTSLSEENNKEIFCNFLVYKLCENGMILQFSFSCPITSCSISVV